VIDSVVFGWLLCLSTSVVTEAAGKVCEPIAAPAVTASDAWPLLLNVRLAEG